ncbi:hypothetical protein B0I35DRAFT_434446 [Stachybotrys elegans]|uniref:Uncharacterized protein n=1 Tax=Stachybotrys elegans TaxID=80388 RepID=A0A8K0WQ98_9HYPO|nr:hypothetical protein B0I35DRAFT_434446 [Stachybotrys elegans]
MHDRWNMDSSPQQQGREFTTTNTTQPTISRWRRISTYLLALYIALIVVFSLLIHYFSPLTNVFRRRPVGVFWTDHDDPYYVCRADDPASWEYGACSRLIGCYLDHFAEILKSDIATGATIAGLLPTILLATAAQPIDLISQALISPHRGLATAAFTIGFPTSLFDRLRSVHHGPDNQRSNIRTWNVIIPVIGNRPFYHIATKLSMDIFIVGGAAGMLYYNWTINNAVLVLWKCESPLLVFLWPISCMSWLVLVVLVLHFMVDELLFEHEPSKTLLTWWQTMRLPYTVDCPSQDGVAGTQQGNRFRMLSRRPVDALRRTDSSPLSSGPSLQRPFDSFCIKISARMPANSFIFTWQTFDLIVEILATAIYFYSTFILLGCIFLGAVAAMRFTSIIASVYIMIRVLGRFC